MAHLSGDNREYTLEEQEESLRVTYRILSIICPSLLLAGGAGNINNCSAERMIPISVIVIGSIFLLFALLDLAWYHCGRGEYADFDDNIKRPVVLKFIYVLIILSLVCWIIAACVYVYRTEPEFESVDSPLYCNKTFYYFVFWLLTLALGLGAVVAIIFCVSKFICKTL